MISKTFKKKILGEVFNIQGYTSGISNFYVALGKNTTTPEIGDSGEISNFTEESGGGYTRVELQPSYLDFQSDGTMVNISPIEFPESTANWSGKVKYWALFGQSSGGTPLACGALVSPTERTVESGTIVIIRSGALSFSINDSAV